MSEAEMLHILLIEDEAAHVVLIRRAFETQPHEIQLEVVNTLQAAHYQLTENQPDLVIAELDLPDGRGIDLLPRDKDEVAYPLIIMAGHGDEKWAVEAMKAGALDYVVKSEAALAAMPRIVERVMRAWQHILERRQAQAALAKSEAILARTQRIAHLGSWEFDLATNEVYWSDEIYRIYGLTRGKIKPNFETAMDFIHPGDRTSAINTAKNALASGEAYHIEKRIVRADGPERHIVAHGEPVFDENQAITGLTGYLQDITERKQTEETLRQSEERYRSLFDYSLDAILIFDDDGRYVEVNQAACHLLGYSREEFVRLTVWDLIPPHRQENIRLDWQTFLEIGQLRGEHKLWRKDKTLIQVEYRALANAIPGLHLAVVHDITEHKRAEAEIRRRNRELALLNRVIAASAASPDPATILETVCQELPQAFEVAWAAAALVDKDQAVATFVAQYVSEGNLLPLPPAIFVADLPVYQHIRQHKAPVAVADAQNDSRLAAIQAIFRERGVVSLLIIPFIVEDHFVGGVGLGTLEPRHFSTEEMHLAQSVADQVGSALAWAWLEEEQAQLEAEYQQAQKLEAVGQLAAGIAHDFSNILMGVMGYAELLYFDLARDDPHREAVSKILGSGQRGANLIRQLLAFSRKQVTQPQVVSLNEVVVEMDELLRRTIHENIILDIKLASNLWPIKADPIQIEQVIINLAVNARDAMLEGGQLTIETANKVLDSAAADHHIVGEAGDYVCLTISDTGHGMSEAVQQRIFEPFFTTKAPGKGTGLGLATVFGIVKQCGGNIEVVSTEGVGTSFKIYIPCSWDSDTVFSQREAETQHITGNETILVVEDDPEICDLVHQALQAYNYTVLSAQNGQEALEVAANHPGPIHLLLTDVIMPGLGGQELAEQLLTTYPGLRIVYMSGYADEAALTDRALQTTAVFLQKPFRPTTLIRKIETILTQEF